MISRSCLLGFCRWHGARFYQEFLTPLEDGCRSPRAPTNQNVPFFHDAFCSKHGEVSTTQSRQMIAPGLTMEFPAIVPFPTWAPSKTMLPSTIAPLPRNMLDLRKCPTDDSTRLHSTILRYGDRQQQADVLGKLGRLITT